MKEQNEKQAIEEMAVEELVAFLWHNTTMYDEDQIFDVAEALYNVGYRKQIEGEWIAKREMYRTPTAKNYYCSVCEKYAVSDTFLGVSKQTNYCPNCGAHMKRR